MLLQGKCQDRAGKEVWTCEPRTAWINGLAGDMVPSASGTLSLPVRSEEQNHLPVPAQGHLPARTYTQPRHFAWAQGRTSALSLAFWVMHVLQSGSGICNVSKGEELQSVAADDLRRHFC